MGAVDARAAFRLGAVANMLAAGALSAAAAFSRPLFSSGDEAAHLDYAYQVWRGRLPVFENGLSIDPSFGLVPPVQWTALHPPLFYLLEAPVVGPFVDADRMLAAGYAGRAVCILLSCALVAAVMWAVAQIAPGRRVLWLVAGAVTAVNPIVIAVGSAVYNDNLSTVWMTLLIGLTARMVRGRVSLRGLVFFAVLAAAALLTRSSSFVIIGACATTLGCALLLRRPTPWRTLAYLVCAVAAAVAASAWFYLRNRELTGNLLGAHWGYLPHRQERPVLEVATNHAVLKQLLATYGYGVVDAVLISLLLVGLPMAVAAVLAVRHLALRRRLVPDAALAALLGGLVIIFVAMQLQYVSRGGGASPRYLEPVIVVVSLGIAWSLTALPRLVPVLVPAWLALAFFPMAASVGKALVTGSPHSTAPLYPGPATAAVALAGAALAASVISVAVLSARAPTTRSVRRSEERP